MDNHACNRRDLPLLTMTLWTGEQQVANNHREPIETN
jgi:hypothetical protein